MNQGREFSQQSIHDAAAFLFWTLAENVGVVGAAELVIETAGRCLLEQSFTSDVIQQCGYSGLAQSDPVTFGNLIAAEAERFAVNGENMNGVIYGEDAQTGRSPSALGVSTVHLKAIPRQVVVSGAKIEKAGRLCLRHPLPAVVFSTAHPTGNVLEVEDTTDAIGFQLPMFMGNLTTTQIGERLFVSRGILHIPVPDVHHGDLWSMVIQNSTRFISGIQFCDSGESSDVDVEW